MSLPTRMKPTTEEAATMVDSSSWNVPSVDIKVVVACALVTVTVEVIAAKLAVAREH